MDITIRPASEDERKAAIEATEMAFGWDVPPEAMDALLSLLEPGRQSIALDGETIVGGGANFTFELSVPGGSVDAAGLTVVGVSPTHRRKGLLRKLMRALLDEPIQRGEVVSILWASESGIYGRFGYGMASQHMQIEAERARMSFLDDDERRGVVRHLSVEEAAKVMPDVYDRVMRETPGMFARSPVWWTKHRLSDSDRSRGGGGPLWRVLLEIEGTPEAYALYRVFSDWPDGNPRGTVQVIETMATSALATREMWRFLFGIDLIDTVKAEFIPVDLPLLHMLADPRRMKRRLGDNLWLRVLDVKGALQGRDYGASDKIVIELRDEMYPDNAGRWALDTTGDSVTVARTDDDADVTMDIAYLGSLYLGGVRATDLETAGRVDTRPGVAERMDVLFRSKRAPWCPEIF